MITSLKGRPRGTGPFATSSTALISSNQPSVLGPGRGADRLPANLRRDPSQFELVDDLRENWGPGTATESGQDAQARKKRGRPLGGSKKRGRPLGSKNRPKDLPPTASSAAVDTQKSSRVVRSGISKVNPHGGGTRTVDGLAQRLLDEVPKVLD